MNSTAQVSRSTLAGFAITGAFAVVLLPATALAGIAEVLEFEDEQAWIDAVGGESAFTTIDFTDLPDNTFVTDQYADLGVLFTDGANVVRNIPAFVEDEWGIDGNDGTELTFATPQLWIGLDFPGHVAIELFSDGELIYASEPFQFGGGGYGWFAGVVSDTPFDQAFLYDPTGQVFIDNVHFGVPAPGVLSVFGLLGFAPPRRRRH